MKSIKLDLKVKHFFSGDYVDNHNCPIAMAAKEHFGAPQVTENVNYLTVWGEDGVLYDHAPYRHDHYLHDYAVAHLGHNQNMDETIRTITLKENRYGK